MLRYVEAWVTEDSEKLAAFYTDDVVLHLQGAGSLSGDFRGKDAFFDVVDRIVELAPDAKVFPPHAVLADDEHVVLLIPERFARGDLVFDTNRVVLYHLKGGLIDEIWTYDGDHAGMSAFYEEAKRRADAERAGGVTRGA